MKEIFYAIVDSDIKLMISSCELYLLFSSIVMRIVCPLFENLLFLLRKSEQEILLLYSYWICLLQNNYQTLTSSFHFLRISIPFLQIVHTVSRLIKFLDLILPYEQENYTRLDRCLQQVVRT
jgi:hypothetical protein